MATPSGATWVSQYPTSTSTDDLADGFREKFLAFAGAMAEAGISVRITATYRPPERAYMMHYSWEIVQGNVDPSAVPALDGVDIDWVAGGVDGAQEMVDGYGIQNLHVPPALKSRHTQRLAVDTVLEWSGDISIAAADGQRVDVKGAPRNATHSTLIEVGKSYGAIHLHPASADPYHWSNDGH